MLLTYNVTAEDIRFESENGKNLLYLDEKIAISFTRDALAELLDQLINFASDESAETDPQPDPGADRDRDPVAFGQLAQGHLFAAARATGSPTLSVHRSPAETVPRVENGQAKP